MCECLCECVSLWVSVSDCLSLYLMQGVSTKIHRFKELILSHTLTHTHSHAHTHSHTQDIVSLSSAQAKRSKIQFLSNYFRDVPVDVQVAMAHAIRCVQYADKHLNSNHVVMCRVCVCVCSTQTTTSILMT